MKKFLVVSIIFSILFVVFGYLSAQSSDDKNACEYARKDSSVDTWKFYLENFPKGECADEAKAALEGDRNAKDQIACNQARQENSFAGWQKYLTNFPNGKCNFEAKVNKKKLKKPTDLEWSDKSSNEMNWQSAINYCKNLNEGGYNDWRLPNIDELRTLIQNHSGTQSGGYCPISEKAGLAWRDRTSGCDGRSGSNFSKLGDTGWFWSSSALSDDLRHAWVVNFGNGYVINYRKGDGRYVRCVR
ncbi:DUF1566 domain-containing protein [bacterium]|nr:DUF1566 domain-containing protein [bacterium]